MLVILNIVLAFADWFAHLLLVIGLLYALPLFKKTITQLIFAAVALWIILEASYNVLLFL